MTCSRLSVGIATRDRPAELSRCLDALLAGTVLPLEVTIVDQGSDERARTVVDARRDAAVSMTYVSQPPRGLSASRNAAIARTHGAVVAFTDDDCVPDRSWVESLCHAFAAESAPQAVTGRMLALGPERPGTHAVSLRTGVHPVDYRGRTVPWRVGTGGNLAISREWLSRIGGFDERLGAGSPGRAAEDADILYRLLAAGAHVRYEPAAVVYHERLNDARRLATRSGYGHGVGAFCGIHLRRGDLFALSMLASWTTNNARQLCRAALARDRSQVQQRRLSLGGTLAGLAYGLRVRPVASAVRADPNGM